MYYKLGRIYEFPGDGVGNVFWGEVQLTLVGLRAPTLHTVENPPVIYSLFSLCVVSPYCGSASMDSTNR